MDWDFEENIRLRGNLEDIRNPRAFRGVAVREKGKEHNLWSSRKYIAERTYIKIATA